MNTGTEYVEVEGEWSLEAMDALIRGEQGEEPRQGWATLVEIMEQTGSARHRIKTKLTALHRTGKLETRKEMREGIDGQKHAVPVYRMKQ